MTVIRKEGKINTDTTLIDIGLSGVVGAGAVYLIEAGKSCLIDCGGRTEAPRIVKTLKELNAFPPDYILLTHSHHDHCQGIPYLRKRAKREQKTFKVFASEKAIPLLKDQSFNKVFNPKLKLKNINDVFPLNDGDIIDLEGITLKIIDIPGHSKDSIAIFDEKNRNIFVACSLGLKFGDQGTFIPPFMPPFWNKDDFFKSIDKLRQIEFEGFCLGHHGYIFGKEAKKFLDESENVTTHWWQIFETAESEGKLDDIKYLADLVINEVNVIFPDFKIEKSMMKYLLRFMNIIRKTIRKNPLSPGEIFFPEVLGWLVSSYKIYNNID